MTPQTPLSATRRVLTAVLEGTPPDAWAAGAARVEDERTSIDRLLASTPLPRIYGFTTLLGHLDDHGASAEDQWTLLDAHLVGTPTRQTAAFGQLLAACKIEQASHGGSGMSPAAFDALRDRAIDTQTGIAGAWTASYGAGDPRTCGRERRSGDPHGVRRILRGRGRRTSRRRDPHAHHDRADRGR